MADRIRLIVCGFGRVGIAAAALLKDIINIYRAAASPARPGRAE